VDDDNDLEDNTAYLIFYNNRVYRPRLNKSTWEALSPEGQQTWDQFSDKDKRTIIQYGMNLKERMDGQRKTKQGGGSTPTNPVPSRQSNVHDAIVEIPNIDDAPNTDIADTTAINKAESRQGEIKTLLGALSKKNPNIKFDINIHENHPAGYSVSAATSRIDFGSLIDRGANGGLCGSDMRVIAVDESRKMNVTGIDNHQLTDLPIVSCGGVINTSKGEVIAIFHQYADIKTGRSIHSSGQLEHFKN
jgi:hypothetical protein